MEEAGLLVSRLLRSRNAANSPRPSQFAKKPTYLEDSDDEESTVGKMPPAEESDSGE